MPKIVDHDQRRTEVLEATWRVIGRLGLEHTTIRAIANEVGLSNGAIAHYFRNKDDIVARAQELGYQRVADRTRDANRDRHGIEALRTALLEALPLDETRHLEAQVDISLAALALSNEALRDRRRESLTGAREWWRTMLLDAYERGEIAEPLRVDTALDAIQAFVDGVSLQAVLFPDLMPPDRQVAVADALIAQLRHGTAPPITE